ncbi:MAG: hypothetical protein CMP61_11140 [Flavobacteriales bacterium]|nr:hypothetical protein [Flavobacteriales bacterium]|tara:strand:+ start:5171 stop:6085 length:915 start_codon:yes stop_codon:yes gene_type:complete
MIWERRGFICGPREDISWLRNGVSSATVDVLNESKGLIKIFVSGRDAQNRTNIGCVEFDVFNHCILDIQKEPILNLGPLGSFDENGQSYPFLVKNEKEDLLFYTGWSPSVLTPFQNFIGLGIRPSFSNDKFIRYSNVPVLDRSNEDYSSTGSCCVLREQGIYKMWYTAFERWEEHNGAQKHYYRIKYATSLDGRNWERSNEVCINFKNSDEFAICRPAVFKWKEKYHMLYSYRGVRYQLGYAISEDGINWKRKDERVKLEGNSEKWENEEICYPAIFTIHNEIYMLYSGNNYGRAGFGLAKLKV